MEIKVEVRTEVRKKIAAIKAFRGLTGCGLREAKYIVEGKPYKVDNLETAIKIKEIIEPFGFKINMEGLGKYEKETIELLYGR